LGIDGGGTKTTCAVGDDSRLLVTATAGPSNIVRVGEDQARESLQRSVRQACAAAGIAPEQVARTCVGGSGAARPERATRVRAFLAEILPGAIDVVGDMEIALEAAFHAGPGVIVIAGTGSIAYGRDPQGKTVRAGGWGFAIGDEGSAHWIGREAVRATLQAADLADGDLIQHSPFAAALGKVWGVKSISDLARAANSTPPPDFSAFLPAVVSSTDEIAVRVQTQAGRELARIAAAVSHRLFDESQTVTLATTGGVFRHSLIVREMFAREVTTQRPRTKIQSQLIEPVEGALRIARRSIGAGVAAQ
jgi:N-acetylglucosamine kinase-like BadF-type ATPase